MERVQKLIEWFNATRVGRTIARYGESRGELLAGGMSFAAVFSAFAALYVAFAAFGIVLTASPDLRDSVIASISGFLPGLIDTGEGGAIDADSLLELQILGWSGAIAVGVLTLTMLGWLASCRDAVRSIFLVPAPRKNPVLLKVADLGLALALGALILLSAAASIISSQAITLVGSLFGFDEDAPAIETLLSIVSLAIGLSIDVLIMAAILRVLAAIPLRAGPLWLASLIGGIGLSALKLLGTALLGGASTNPLLASFAVLIGLLLFFNLVSRVILYAAAFAAVGPDPLIPGTSEALYLEPEETGPRRRWWRFWRREEDAGIPPARQRR